MRGVQFFGPDLLDPLSAAARQNPRLRQHHNLHDSLEAPAQRLFNAIEPGSYVMPHRHLAPGKNETLLMLRGRLGVLIFDDTGQVSDTRILSAASDAFGYQLELGVWHSVVALESGTVFFEVKDGPYLPISNDERAPWAPAEGSPDLADYLKQMRAHFPS